MMRLKQCQPNEVLMFWPVINGWIASALNHGGVFLTPENVWAALLNNQMTLWVAMNEDNMVRGCAVTQIVHYPKIKCGNWIVVGGIGLDDWAGFRTEIEAAYRSAGCEAMESMSRRGMAKKMLAWGYKPLVTILRKSLTEDQ